MMNDYDHSFLQSRMQSQRSNLVSPYERPGLASIDDYNQTYEEDVLQEAEKLPVFEKLKHPKWQVRRKAYVDLTAFFHTKQDLSSMQEDNLNTDSFLPWLKNIVNEQNLIALAEGLKTLQIFLANYSFNRSLISCFAGEIIERLVVTKTTIQSLVTDILDKLIALDESNLIPTEILKRLEHCKLPKYMKALLNTLNKFFKLNQSQSVDANIIRLCFKSTLHMLEHTSKDIRVASLEVIKTLYSRVEEDFEALEKTVFSGLRSVHLKDIEKLKSCPKLKKQRLIKLMDGIVRYTDNAKRPAQKIILEQRVELSSLLPDKYLEVPYLTNKNDKHQKLEEFNDNIQGVYSKGGEIEGNKDCSVILQILTLMLEDQNILINGEAVKTMRHLMRIFSRAIPLNKLKHILHLIVDKVLLHLFLCTKLNHCLVQRKEEDTV